MILELEPFNQLLHVLRGLECRQITLLFQSQFFLQLVNVLCLCLFFVIEIVLIVNEAVFKQRVLNMHLLDLFLQEHHIMGELHSLEVYNQSFFVRVTRPFLVYGATLGI